MGSRMRKLFTVGSSLALAVAVFLGLGASGAEAQSSFYVKKAPFSVTRLNAGTDNPNRNGGVAPTAYTLNRSDGNHNAANLGVAVGVEDTFVVDVRDHWLHAIGAYRAFTDNASGGLRDSTWFGTLQLQSNSSTIDSVTVLKDISPDGVAWSAVDSLGSHLISGQVQITIAQGADSCRFTPTVLSGSSGSAGTFFAFETWACPSFNRLGVTALAVQGVNFVRFRIHMTPGDFAAAGTTKYLTGEFDYPAVDSNWNRPDRAVLPLAP